MDRSVSPSKLLKRSAPEDPYVSPTTTAPAGPTRANFGQEAPDVLAWFRFYSGLMALVSLFSMSLGLALLLAPAPPTAPGRAEPIVYGIFLFVLGAMLAFGFGVGVFAPRQPWMWFHGLVLLGLGMTSICLLQFTIPLLVYWMKRDVKLYFDSE